MLFYFGCSTDDSLPVESTIEEKEVTPLDTTWVEREIGADEIKNIPWVYPAIEEINALSGKDSKPFYIGNYLVEDATAVEINQGDRISYTFSLLPKTASTSDIINLVFTIRDKTIIGTEVVVYYLTEEDWQVLNETEEAQVEVPVGYLALDKEYKPIEVETTEVDGGERHLSSRMAPPLPTYYDGALGQVLLEGGAEGSPSSPSFGLPRHPNLNTGSPGMSSGNSSHGGGGSSGGATKPVTAPNKVIIDKSFKDNKCLNGVYEKMGGVSGFDKYLKRFKENNNPVAHLKLSRTTALPNKTYANTIEPEHYMIEIEFNLNEPVVHYDLE